MYYNFLSHESLQQYKKINLGVIDQALIDALTTSLKKRAHKIRVDAIAWLLLDNIDFPQVCLMAGLEPEYVRKKALELISRKLPNYKILLEKVRHKYR